MKIQPHRMVNTPSVGDEDTATYIFFLVSKLGASKVFERTNAVSSQVEFQRHATMQEIADSNTGLLKALEQSRSFKR